MHYFRFLTRADLAPDTLNNAERILDFPNRFPRSAGDVLVYTKRWLGDKSIVTVASLVPEVRAAEIRQQAHAPAGIAAKRLISPKVQKRIWRQAPICFKHGDISNDAYEFLMGWSQGQLPEIPRPAQYGILNYRWDSSGLPTDPGTLAIPNRVKTCDLGLDPDGSESESASSDEGDIDLP